MHDRTFVFFSGTNSIKDNQQESLTERVKKYIDAEIAYKKIIAERLLKGSDEETWEIMLSNTLHLSNMPLQIDAKLQNEEVKRSCRKSAVKRTIDDMKDCNRLKNSAEKDSIDILYLNIYFQYQLGLIDIETTLTKQNTKTLLNAFYQKKQATMLLKRITKDINTKDKNSPIMASTNLKEEMLTILKTEISPSCQRFLEDVEIICVSGNYAVGLTTKVYAKLKNNKLINRLQKMLPNSLAQNLITEYSLAEEVLFQDPLVFGHMTLNDRYLNLFESMKVLYQLEERIANFLLDLERQALEAKTALVAPLLETIPAEAIVDLVGVEDDRQEIQTATSELCELNSETTTQESEIPQIMLPIAINSEVQKPIPERVDELKEELRSQAITVPAPLETINFANTEESEKSQILSSETETPIYTAIYQPYPSKNKERKNQESILPVKPQQNTLNLNKEHQDTFMKVFGLMPYDSINLRALVNLTLQFGGVIKKTGANRCRIEIKNIYAFILLPQEQINPSTSSTITMHGGGHRSTRSQNNDREKTPDYLIDQFRDAFTRSGFTPANLGLEYSGNSKSFTS